MKPSKPKPSTVKAFLSDSGRVTQTDMLRTWPILEEMLTLYYPPFRADTDEELLEQTMVALRRYIQELSVFDRDTLAKAWGEVVSRHTVERWPTIGAIAAECRVRDPQARTSGYMPGEMRGFDASKFPVKHLPDYDYQVENGLMTREQAGRHLARYRNRGDEAERKAMTAAKQQRQETG